MAEANKFFLASASSIILLTAFDLNFECCNSNMDILQIMPVNMVNASRLQINASGKQVDSNTP